MRKSEMRELVEQKVLFTGLSRFNASSKRALWNARPRRQHNMHARNAGEISLYNRTVVMYSEEPRK